MSAADSKVINPSRRLPNLSLPSIPAGQLVPIRPRLRRSPVLIVVHGTPCPGCRDFVSRLEAEAEDIEAWDGYPLVVTTGFRGGLGITEETASFPIVLDEDGRLDELLGIRPPALIIADQWGEIHEMRQAGEDHEFPEASEVVSYLRYLSTQCPECQGESF